MFDAIGSDQLIGDFLHSRGLASHRQNFQAVVVVQVDMKRGKDHIMMIMLDIGEGRLHMLAVMIVNQSYRAGDFAITIVLPVFDQARPYEISHR